MEWGEGARGANFQFCSQSATGCGDSIDNSQ